MKNFKTVYEKIKTILENDPMSRSCDMYMISQYARMHYGTDNIQLNSVLIDMKDKKFPSFESLTRLRRKVQELHPVLIGHAELKRKALAEKVRDDMNNFQEPIAMQQGFLL